MRRSEFFQRKKLTKTIVVFVILLIGTIILISTVGLKLLLNYSVFVANLFSKNTTTELNKNTDVYGLISIDLLPDATNSAELIVSGSVINYDKIQFYINNEKVKEINSQSKDTFTEEIGDLQTGENKIYAKAMTKDNKIFKKTEVYTVIYKSSMPKLEISEPQDGSKTSQSEIVIKGSTDKEVFIQINNLPVTVDANGNFQSLYRLKEGENKIRITATDIAENVESRELTLTYQKE